MVNLKKEDLNKPIREYTPVHIREEYTPSQEYTPEHLCEEFNPNQDIPVVEVLPPKQELAAPAEHNISYSQAISDCRSQYLASIFRRASEAELKPFRSPSASIKKTLKRHALAAFSAIVALAIGLLSIMGALTLILQSSDNSGEPLIFTLCVLCFSIFAIWLSLKDDDNSQLLYKTLKNATDVFVSHDGANDITISKIKKCSQRIDCDVFRPYFCKDDSAYKAVIRDKHDVYVIYSDKTKSAVIIDPKLFE
jgi:hypothetical protein